MFLGGDLAGGALRVDAALELGAEVADEALHGPGRGVAQRADGVALDLLGELLQHVDLLQPRVALLHALHDGVQPPRALTAGRALAAGLVLVEVGEARDGVHHVGALVHDDDGGGAEAGLRGLERVEVHEHLLAHLLGDERHGGAAGDDAQQVVPAAAHAPRVLLDQLLQRDAHLLLHRARVVDVPADAEQLGAGVVLAPERREPLRAAAQNRGRHRHGLDVGDRGGAPVQPHAGGERRLQARLALLALQALDQRRLLAADVRPRAVVDVDVEVDAAPARVLAQEPRGVRLVACPLQGEALVDVLPADVDVARARAHGGARDQAPLDQLVRVVPHDFAVLARAGLGLVGVDDQVGRTAVRYLWHEGPLEAGGEAGAAAPAQARRLDFVDDPVRAHQHEVLGAMPVPALHRPLEERVVDPIQVGEDAVLVAQPSVVALRGGRG
eukprot:CAMPEP_0197590548 /NCGR_PEP_ID=MMETSP1326-20131121/11475_1 /TAXON_ID=1155430 /ORGANISM="Genus nov. species nov., Strain RCC2288" /LENGTH=441 /DNA_ID=CAMNT_0043155651 /DNA_START=195 /DNA_END=1517 /DNA_ORIENTATION=-